MYIFVTQLSPLHIPSRVGNEKALCSRLDRQRGLGIDVDLVVLRVRIPERDRQQQNVQL